MTDYLTLSDEINSLTQDIVRLNKLIKELHNQTTIENAKKLIFFANGISMEVSAIAYKINSCAKARWITEDEYTSLISKFEDVKDLLRTMGVEGL